MLTFVIALIGVVLIAISVAPKQSRLFPIGLALFLLGWAVLPMVGIH